MNKISILILLSIVLLSACRTAKESSKRQQISPQHVELGIIGVSQTQLTTKSFETLSIPTLQEKIRVQIKSIPFSKTTYKAYQKALINQKVGDSIKYSEKATIKPIYVDIKMLDQIGYINELQSNSNKSIVEYLKNIEHSRVVTGISAAFNNQNLDQLSNAEEVYLVNRKNKKYALELYINNKVVQTMEFSDAVIFGYQISGFCWAKTNNNSTISNLSTKESKCERGTQKNPQDLEEKINYMKLLK